MPFAQLDVAGSVARVTLDHPGGNRINFAMRTELLDAMEQVALGDARVLIIQGTGPDFCLGGDIRDWPGLPAATLQPSIEVFAKALDLLAKLPIPTVAAVQGGCMGGGFELALGCDMIVAAADARFAFPEARLGILTLQGGVMRLAERVGRAKAIELAFLSEPVSAAQMATWNVVNRVVETGSLEREIEVFAGHLAAGSPQVHAATKDLLRVWSEEGPRQAMDAWYTRSMPLFDTADVQTALHNATEAISAGTSFPTATFGGR